MAATLSDIQLNIVVNVRNAASLQALNSTLSGIAAQQGQMARSALASAQATQRQVQAFGGLKSRLDETEKNFDALFRASYRLMNVGYQLIGAAKEMFSAIKSTTDAWGQFEFMTNRAAGALQIWRDSATALNPVYEALIQNLLAATKELRLFPAADVAKATYFWGSTTGQTVRSLADLKVVMEAINPLMKVSALTQTSYEQAIKGTYSVIVQYGKSLSDVEDVTNKMFLVTQRTALEFGDLVQSFKYVGPTAHALGVTFEEVAQVLGALGDAGIRGSQSGRALRQMFIRLVKPPMETAAALDNLYKNTITLGKSFNEIVFPNGKFIGITGFVRSMALALKDATVAQRNHVYAIASTANELPVLTALVENQIKVMRGQADAYDMTKASVDDAANAAMQFKKNWDLLSESWVGLTERLERGVEVIKIQVGRVLAGALAGTVKNLTAFLDRIERWVRHNPSLVKNLGQLGAALAAVAAVAGGMFLLSGALLGVYAAINVIVKGFGPLAGVAGTVLGTIVLVAEAIIDNWVRVERLVVPAFNRFIAALTGGESTIQGVRDEWAKLHETFKGVVDFLVKQAINALKLVLDLLTAIADSPVRGVLEGIAQAFILAFGLKTLGTILGVGKALRGLLTVIFLARSGLLGLEIAGKRAGIAAVFAGKGIGNLTLALRNMSGTTVLVVLTAIVTAIQLLGDILPSTSKNVNDLRDEMLDFYSSVGSSATRFQQLVEAAAITNIPGAAEAAAQAKAYTDMLDDLYSKIPGGSAIFDLNPIASFFALGPIKEKAAEAEQVVLEAAKRYKSMFEEVAADTERSFVDIYGYVKQYGTALFGDLTENNNFDKSIEAARQYFKAIGDGTELTAQGAVRMWNALTAQGIRLPYGPLQFLRTQLSADAIETFANEAIANLEVQKARVALKAGDWDLAYSLLTPLKTDADKYSADFNATITRMLSGIPQATSQVLEDATGLMDQAPKDMLAALIDGFKSLGNIKERFQAALKQQVKAGDLLEAIIGDINATEVTKAFESKNVSMNLWAQSVIDNAYTSFTTAVAAYTSQGKQSQLVAAIEKAIGPDKIRQIVTGAFKGKWWGKLSAEQQIAFQTYADWWAQQVGLTSPSGLVVANVAATLRSKAEKLFREQFESEVQLPEGAADPMLALVNQMRPSVDTGVELVSGFVGAINNIFATGFKVTNVNPVAELNAGMNEAWTMTGGVMDTTNAIAESIKNRLMGSSPPPLGPLRTIDKGGLATMMSYVSGLRSSIPFVDNVVGRIANVIYDRLTFSLVRGGFNTIMSWARGARLAFYAPIVGAKAVIDRMAAYIRNRLAGNSPPPMGPLKNIDLGGYNVMKAWADGISHGGAVAIARAEGVSASVHDALAQRGLMSGNPITVTGANERYLKIDIDISSKDGSVNAMDIGVLKESLVPELIRSIEHMASVSE